MKSFPRQFLRVGIVEYGTPPSSGFADGYIAALSKLGFSEPKTLQIERRYAQGNAARYGELLQDLAATKVDLVFAVGHDIAHIAKKVGFNDVRIEKICEETNLSRPTFYAHFSNKDSIVSELLCRFMDGIARELEARTRGSHDLEAVIDVLVSLCHYGNSKTSERLRRELAAYLPRHHDIDLFSTSPVYSILTQAIIQSAQWQEIRPVPDPRSRTGASL